MNTVNKFSAILLLLSVTFFVACGESAKDKKGELNDKKVELQKLKDQQAEISGNIEKLEKEITTLDPTVIPAKPKLVATTTVKKENFEHFIDLQGVITTENIYYVSPRGMGGQVRQIYVQQGQPVRKGQLVVKLDDALIRQQIEQANIQLDYLKDIYQRRKNLWDQNIGTEVELVTARNSVTAQEKQIGLLKEQLDMTNVYSQVSGIAEEVNIRVGEMLTPQTASMAGIRVVNTSDLKAEVNVPENYINKVKKGTPVVIEIGDADKKFNSTISLISQIISTNNRGFRAEAKVPGNAGIKPNSIAIVRIRDYEKKDAITVPLNSVQTDEKGKFVMVAVIENGKKIARKKQVAIGELYDNQIEVLSGLQDGDQVITQGYQGLYEGQLLTTDQV